MTQREPSLLAEDQDVADKVEAEYRKYGESLQSANHKTREELDKTFITLSTAIIGVMLTFRQQIAGANPELGFPIVFWIAILSLFMCIIAVLGSHFLSLQVNERIIKLIYDQEDWQSYKNLVQKTLYRTSCLQTLSGMGNGVLSSLIKQADSGNIQRSALQRRSAP